MKKFLFLSILATLCLPSWAQLSEKDLSQLSTTVKSNYQQRQIEGANVYTTASGYQVLVTVTSVSADKDVTEQNREAQMKSTRLASEFLGGAMNTTVSVYNAQSTSNSNKEELSDKIIQSAQAQVKAMQPLFRMQSDEGQSVYAYYLVISQTAAKNRVAGVLSIVPGVGQFYKGSVAKGTMFLGLSAAAVAGIIVCESTRSSYANKAIEQPKYKKEYSTKADNWQTSRNICIGVGGAIWVWNIVDAFTTKSAKRKVVTTQRGGGLSIQPFATTDYMGMGLTFNF